MGIILSKPEIYVPETIITNHDLEKLVDTSDEWIVERTGIKERRISFDLGVREMGAIASERVLAANDVYGYEISEVIFATNWHDGNKEFPCHAGFVAEKNHIASAAISDVGGGCTGLVYALRQAYNNMLAEPKLNKVLVVGGERLTDMTDYSDRDTCVLFGDAVGAYILERSESEEGIINNFVGGEPDVGDANWPSGFLSLEEKIGIKLRDSKFSTEEVDQNYLIMNGQPVFKFASRVMRHAVHEVLEGTDYSLEDVDVIIPHGANMRIIDSADKGLRKKGFKGRIYTNLERFGNTSTASIPLAANEAYKKEVIKRGSLVVNVAFGAGFTFGANLYRATHTGQVY
jgi:3-oxoacyl-[acyl-carrier-protein] synthase III